MKYLRRWRRRSRAGRELVEVLDEAGRRTLAVGGDGAGHLPIAPRSRRPPREAWLIAASPSPLRTQSMAPSPCSRMSAAMKDALWPPTKMKVPGSASFVALARSTISGIRWRDSCRRRRWRPAPFGEQAVIVRVGLDLQIDEFDRVRGAARGLRHPPRPPPPRPPEKRWGGPTGRDEQKKPSSLLPPPSFWGSGGAHDIHTVRLFHSPGAGNQARKVGSKNLFFFLLTTLNPTPLRFAAMRSASAASKARTGNRFNEERPIAKGCTSSW